MNATQMKYEAQLLYESIASADAPGYTSREWSFLLTAGQEKVIKEIIDQGLDEEEKHRKAISSLFIPMSVSMSVTNDYTSTLPNSLRVPLDADCLGVTMERCIINYGTVSVPLTKLVTIKPIKYDFYEANLQNPLKKPDKRYVFWRLDGSTYKGTTFTKDHIIIGDTTSLKNYYDYITTYKYVKIKKPSPIIVKDSTYTADHGTIDGIAFYPNYVSADLDSVLDSFVHRWIIQEAVNIAYASDKDQIGYQLAQFENKNNTE